jgi:hypothetical protein
MTTNLGWSNIRQNDEYNEYIRQYDNLRDSSGDEADEPSHFDKVEFFSVRAGLILS